MPERRAVTAAVSTGYVAYVGEEDGRRNVKAVKIKKSNGSITNLQMMRSHQLHVTFIHTHTQSAGYCLSHLIIATVTPPEKRKELGEKSSSAYSCNKNKCDVNWEQRDSMSWCSHYGQIGMVPGGRKTDLPSCAVHMRGLTDNFYAYTPAYNKLFSKQAYRIQLLSFSGCLEDVLKEEQRISYRLDYTVWAPLPPAKAELAHTTAGKHRPAVQKLPSAT
ncbi:hypothetical protein LXL04_016379 [Taraxacum kok-saghyz]